ncbi:MAG: Spy/CpxP family protein refolding chaperone [Pseudomonadota bacterium]|nr:Spy/CpxP family protein refolding chaperone [Pseudomonadota bacterium]MDP1903721.1 Spy/CpxP family protein refolding chaperone [Pseudomonadota bacterium]MDP2353446.1 Spy/CpxP family protein refolding chaperone [Pseudomonadota bacterium]
MKFRNHILTAFLAASSIALVVPLTTQARSMGDMGGCDRLHAMQGERDGLPPMMKRLNLTDEQKDKISQLRKQDAGLMAEKFKAMRDARSQLHEMQSKGEYDEAKVKVLTEQGAQTMAEMGQMRARQHHEVMQILTPDQRKQVAEKRERMMKHRDKRHENRQG